MDLSLDANAQKLIAERVNSGKYTTAEDVVAAALHALQREESAGEFDPGDWDGLLAQGEASGDALEGQAVLTELREARARHRPSKTG